LFHIGTLEISSYFFFNTLGFIVGLAVFLLFAKKQSLPLVEIAAFALFGVAVSILGGKLFNAAVHFVRNVSSGLDWFQGIGFAFRGRGSFYGGLAGGSFFALWYLRRYSLPFWNVGDALAPAIALGHAVMKVGCFMGGCCFGRPSQSFLAVNFPSLPEARHPAQLYETAFNILNFFILALVFRKRRFEGQLVSLYVINYSIIHFLLVYFRDNPRIRYVWQGPSVLTSLSFGQLINVLGLIFGVLLYAVLKRKAERTPPAGL
jgi:phosphatidylglycerol:prolipoprotein diacylglycerol transferase